MSEDHLTEERLRICAEQWGLSALRHEAQARQAEADTERQYWLAEAAADRHEVNRIALRLAERPAA
jgi:hypothetical protein